MYRSNYPKKPKQRIYSNQIVAIKNYIHAVCFYICIAICNTAAISIKAKTIKPIPANIASMSNSILASVRIGVIPPLVIVLPAKMPTCT